MRHKCLDVSRTRSRIIFVKFIDVCLRWFHMLFQNGLINIYIYIIYRRSNHMTCRLNRLWPRLDPISNSFALISITFKAAGSAKLVVAPILELHVSPLAFLWQAHTDFGYQRGVRKGSKRRLKLMFQQPMEKVVSICYLLCFSYVGHLVKVTSHFYGNLGCQIRVRTDVKKTSLPRHTLEAQVVILWPQD